MLAGSQELTKTRKALLGFRRRNNFTQVVKQSQGWRWAPPGPSGLKPSCSQRWQGKQGAEWAASNRGCSPTQHGRPLHWSSRMQPFMTLAAPNCRNSPSQHGHLQFRNSWIHSRPRRWQRTGVCKGRPDRHIAVHVAGRGSGAAHGRAQFAGTRQHCMGVWQRQTRQTCCRSGRWQGQRGSTEARACAGTRPHCMGGCEGRLGRHIAVHGASKGSGAALGRAHPQELANTAWTFAMTDQAVTWQFAPPNKGSEQRMGELICRTRQQARQTPCCSGCWQGQRSSARASSSAGTRQHYMGVCKGRSGRHMAVHVASKGSGAAHG